MFLVTKGRGGSWQRQVRWLCAGFACVMVSALEAATPPEFLSGARRACHMVAGCVAGAEWIRHEQDTCEVGLRSTDYERLRRVWTRGTTLASPHGGASGTRQELVLVRSCLTQIQRSPERGTNERHTLHLKFRLICEAPDGAVLPQMGAVIVPHSLVAGIPLDSQFTCVFRKAARAERGRRFQRDAAGDMGLFQGSGDEDEHHGAVAPDEGGVNGRRRLSAEGGTDAGRMCPADSRCGPGERSRSTAAAPSASSVQVQMLDGDPPMPSAVEIMEAMGGDVPVRMCVD
jgi:hypothetical protein